jgi:hypothetical protein
MKSEGLRKLCDSVPFHPFVICMADGRRIAVRHQDFIMNSPSGRTAVVYQANDSFDIIDVPLVAALHVKANGTGSKRGK